MTNDDEPLDLEDRPFAADLDAPARPAPARAGADDGWGDDPVTGPGTGAEPGRNVADEWVRPAGQSSSLLLIIGAVVLVMVGVVVFLALNGNDDEKASDPPATQPAPAGGQPAAGGGAPPSTVPDPGNDPELEDPATIADDFERPDGDLGAFPGAGAWTNQVGTIGVEKGTARTVAVDPDSPLQLATVDAGAADVTVEVRLPSPVDRAGIAIRVASPDRFIGLFATSDYGTYTLGRFENGELAEDDIIGNTDLSGVGVDDVIGIRAVGSKVEVLTNGTVRNSFDDPKLEVDGTAVGLFAFLDESGPEPIDARDFANWDDVRILPAAPAGDGG
ncbi:MAG TPA: hypothetical protein VHK88_17050 [Aquihabitans sp.]|jgi:hypothetical protein|nr:hypothetical protein [Aquihabitans sp.]